MNNLQVLFRKEEVASAQFPPDIFSCLKIFVIGNCSRKKKLLLAGLLLHLHNLEEIEVRNCGQLEEIIAEVFDEFEGEEKEGIVTTKITLPRLRTLELRDLPELKTICSSRKVIVCDSLERVEIIECQKLKRLPHSLPLLNGQLSPPLSLKKIKADKEWWESLDCQDTKNVLQPFFWDPKERDKQMIAYLEVSLSLHSHISFFFVYLSFMDSSLIFLLFSAIHFLKSFKHPFWTGPTYYLSHLPCKSMLYSYYKMVSRVVSFAVLVL